ncbi:putative ABC transporter permease [Clostridium sp. 19966]|uniref:putative ABC transporter permease n=1 Tax=Clostridium sp. 19966 TaxID=2768166 RepID=UPI0028DFC2C5|nr:putative ABC transporter permease [Clostridium sp. 19966]MDT8718378.1 putative ABC transporter permease [Clostridium sp. 19966]
MTIILIIIVKAVRQMSNFIEAAYYFLIYSFMGWIVENIYCLSTEKRFLTEGFLKGPYKPMYGIAMSIVLLCKDAFGDNILFITILCFLIPTAVEYSAGYILKMRFNKVYWDYSEFKHNIFGYVCLEFSCYWAILGISVITLIHPVINSLYMNYTGAAIYLVTIIIPIFIIDLIFTVIKAHKSKAFAD